MMSGGHCKRCLNRRPRRWISCFLLTTTTTTWPLLCVIVSVEAFFCPRRSVVSHVDSSSSTARTRIVLFDSYSSTNQQDFAPSNNNPTTSTVATTVTTTTLGGKKNKHRVLPPVPNDAKVLSEEPLVYTVPYVLSSDECRAYMERVQYLSSSSSVDDTRRSMTRSNPPKVSISIQKLWPLPFLSLGAGIPPLLRLLAAGSEKDALSSSSSVQLQQLPPWNQVILQTVLPNVMVAFAISLTMVVLAVPLLQRVYADSSSRTSDAMAFNTSEDVDFVRPLVDRICHNVTPNHSSWTTWEAPVVTRYPPGAIFAPHGDASPSSRGSEWTDQGGQRLVTCIVYLNTIQEGGGETSFGKLGIAVKPVQGTALVFFPAHADTHEADDRTVHESLATTSSREEKWIVQMFGRVGPRVPPPLGLPDSYGD